MNDVAITSRTVTLQYLVRAGAGTCVRTDIEVSGTGTWHCTCNIYLPCVQLQVYLLVHVQVQNDVCDRFTVFDQKIE